VPLEAVVLFNKQQTSETGENHALLFPEKLEGALMRPQNAWLYEKQYDIVSLTVNLMLAIYRRLMLSSRATSELALSQVLHL